MRSCKPTSKASKIREGEAFKTGVFNSLTLFYPGGDGDFLLVQKGPPNIQNYNHFICALQESVRNSAVFIVRCCHFSSSSEIYWKR